MIRNQEGFTLIEVLIGLAILGIVSSGIYQAYASVLEIIQSAQYNSAALSIIETQVETVRNMRYEDVGTVGGVPAGLLPQLESVQLDGITFTLHNYVRNIDDPFDGTLGGSPGDTAPADYKFVEFQITCDECTRYDIITMATYIAPKNLESSSKRGNLFIKVFDADGEPVSGATVHVTNTKVTPQINLTDITSAAGMLQLVDTATVSAGYHIVVTKSGYSSDQTYPPGTPPNPLKPDATVASQQLTITSLTIDRLSTLTIHTRDQFCAGVPGMDFLVTGGKLIGTSPDTPKYSQSHATDASGAAAMELEWDSYAFAPTDTVWDIAGVAASLSLTINPDTTARMDWLVASASQSGLVVAVTSTAGVPLDGATVRVSKTGYDRTVVTGRSNLTHTDWTGSQSGSQSGGISATTSLVLLPLGGPYVTSGSEQWLISDTFNLGTSSATFRDLQWNPASQPPGTTARFQLAANNDQATWNFIGPDGTAGSYFTTTGTATPASLNGNRYLQYKVFLQTTAPMLSPVIEDVTIGFSSGCLVSGQSYFNGLAPGTYTVDVSLPGYQSSSGPLVIINDWTKTTVTLTP